MKKHLLPILFFTSLVLFLSCNKELDSNENESDCTPFEIIASATAESKTANNEMNTKWSAGDEINLFHAITSSPSYISDGKFIITEEHLSENIFSGSLSSPVNQE